MRTTEKGASRLYLLNLSLLVTHEIDSAYWHEWELFHLPGGIDLFLFLNFGLLCIFLFGYARVVLWTRGARVFSYVLASSGIFAFVIHMIFIALGHPQFRTSVSIALLFAILMTSIIQFRYVASLRRQLPAPTTA